jgi:hypothetical protein
MSSYNPQPYTSYTPREYRDYKLEKFDNKESVLGPYYVKVSTRSEIPEEKQTPAYETTTEAFTHAYGWVDRSHYNQTDSDENGDSWKRAYEKLRETQKEYYKFIPDENVEVHMKEEKERNEKLERVYKAGWETELQQFQRTEVQKTSQVGTVLPCS